MIRFSIAALMAISAFPCPAQPEQNGLPPGVTVAQLDPQPQPWMGVDLVKPDPALAAQLKGLPANVGFIVKSVQSGGPGEQAGLRPMDVIWKMGDQLLVNVSQMGVLLSLQKPGDSVKLSAYRGGEPLEISLKLGQSPDFLASIRREVADQSVLPVDSSPMRVVNLAEKSATFSNDEGRAIVTKMPDGYKILITGKEDTAVFDQICTQDQDFEQIPTVWRGKISALRRGLDQALEGGGVYTLPPRQPRPRVIPAPAQIPPKS